MQFHSSYRTVINVSRLEGLSLVLLRVCASTRRRPRGEVVRHLVYIATPGDAGTDNQSGVVVLDADKGYSFLKRIPYGLTAAEMPGPKNAGIAVSVPLQMLYVTSDGWMKAIDLSTDQIAWTFNGETTQPVARTRGAASGCCERPWRAAGSLRPRWRGASLRADVGHRRYHGDGAGHR